jgi:hypothetical protein
MALVPLLYTFKLYVAEPILVNTVSKNMVSLENSKFPKLGIVEKSFLQELTEITATQIRKAIM